MPGTLQLIAVGRTPNRIQSFMVPNEIFMIVNPDIINPIYVGNDPGQQLIAVPALGSMSLSAENHDIWVSTNGGNYVVNAYLMPNGSNWTPSPAQVAAQINALGLAKDTTVQTGNTINGQTNTILGTPAQDPTLTNVVSNTTGAAKETGNLATAATQLVAGVSPLVPNYFVIGNHGLGPQVAGIVGPPTTGFRVWHISLTYGMYANGALASAQTGYAAVRTHNGGVYLNVVDNGIGLFSGSNVSGSAQSVVSQVMPLNGYPIAAGESLDLNVNNNGSLTNILQRCAYSVYYSVP
jgi:hypothetical protein